MSIVLPSPEVLALFLAIGIGSNSVGRLALILGLLLSLHFTFLILLLYFANHPSAFPWDQALAWTIGYVPASAIAFVGYAVRLMASRLFFSRRT
jgi:hypothetical protein